MTKKQKEIGFSEFIWNYGWSILAILVIVLIAIWLNFILDNNYCKNNPDKCVCERVYGEQWCDWQKDRNRSECIEYAHNLMGADFNRCDVNCCGYSFKLRLKTQPELDIQSCQENPRDDDLCKCEEYKNTEHLLGEYMCPNSCKEIIIKECKIKGLYYYGEEIEYTGNFIFGDQCELNPVSNFGITHAINVTMQIIEKNITNCEQCFEYEKVCTKSRPKTNWEKYPEDYVEEIKCIQTKEVLENYTTHELKCPEIINNPTNMVVQHIPCSSELVEVTVHNFVKKDICVKNQTTYRFKNECEKINPDWVEEIETRWKCKDLDNNNYIDSSNECIFPYNKTICRKKTDELTDKDCDELFLLLRNSGKYFEYKVLLGNCERHNKWYKQITYKVCDDFQNLKQAWRQKGCQI